MSLSASERAEVSRFLNAGEDGLAIDTLSWILVEERKPIAQSILREIDSIAGSMQLCEERFMLALHNAHEQQIAQHRRVS